MSHGFEENDTMFSVGERPWHGLGTVIPRDKILTMEEAIQLAGLDWEVELKPLQTIDGLAVDSRKAVVRKDNNAVLGVVSNGYTPVQNKECFNFFEPFLENDMVSLETAGSLFGGKRVFVLAKIKTDNMVIDKDDEVEKYALFSNGHDGWTSIRVGFCCIRVVCNNTLTLATNAKTSKLIRVTHTGDVKGSLNDIRETMDMVNKDFNTTEEMYKKLAARKNIVTADVHRYVHQVFSAKRLEDIIRAYEEDEQKAKEEIEVARKKLIARVDEIWETEKVHNAWTMYNSVNSYLNHNKNKDINARYQGMWFGDSRTQDIKALELALTY